MTKIHCKCVQCGEIRVYNENDPIDEAGPTCESCWGVMVPFKAESTAPSESAP